MAEAAACARVVYCDVASAPVDALTVDCLAQLHLIARRNDTDLRLVNVSPALRDLVTFMGLDGVLLE